LKLGPVHMAIRFDHFRFQRTEKVVRRVVQHLSIRLWTAFTRSFHSFTMP